MNWGAQVVDVGHEVAAQLAHQAEQGMAIEVGPDQAAGDAALVAGEAAGIRRSQGVEGGLLAADAVGDGLGLGK